MRCTVEGRDVFVWPRYLSAERCRKIESIVPWRKSNHDGTVERLPLVVDAVSVGIVPDDAPPIQWLNYVTIGEPSWKGGEWHVDRPRGAMWKLCLYLRDVPEGGTEFSKVEKFCPESPLGTVVLFDIRLEHRSRPFEKGLVKRVMGLRGVPG